MPERYVYEVRFARGRAIKYISHLDMMRTWERMLRRAGLPVAHSEGFNPRPRLTFAAPLAVGVLAENDLAEFTLTEPVPPEASLARLEAQTPPGLGLRRLDPVLANRPALQARLREALYMAEVRDGDAPSLEEAIARLLASATLPTRNERKGKDFDLRPLILALELVGRRPPVLAMRLRHDAEATGRPTDVLQALGVDPLAAEVTRTGLVLAPA